MRMNRRTFLVAGASAVAFAGCRGGSESSQPGATTAPTTTTTTTTATSTTTGSTTTTTLPAASGSGRLVIVTLHGGNDALNTVIPVGDSKYAQLRGDLAIDAAAAHDVGDGFALNPELDGMKGLWDAGRLAIVHGVGFPELDRSHFHCMDVWQAGNTDDLGTGWLGRWLDAVSDDPLDAVAVGSRLPLLMRGARRSAAVVPVGPLTLPGDDRLRRSFTELTAADPSRSPLAALVASTTAESLELVDTVGPLLDVPAPDSDDAAPGGLADGAEGELAAQLDVVATLIDAEMPTRVYAVELGGFDTHANQAGTHTTLMGQLDGAISGFLSRVPDDVTVLVYSEFGRRVAPNASAGTDHGRAGTVMLAGAVIGGHHGAPPPLDRLDDGDLATTVDFRSIYAGLLQDVIGIDAGDILPGAPAPLALVG